MANIYDVAREAGVSRSTVSRVINHYQGVNEKKRIKVLEAIEKLNYVPNATARDLALKETNTIGVIARELAEEFYGEFIKYLHARADYLHYGALYCIKDSVGYSNINYVKFLNKKVDGYVFLGEMTATYEELQQLSNSKFPVVMCEVKYDIPNITYVTIDNFEAVNTAIKYLVDLGHEKIANIGANKVTEFLQRTEAYEQAIDQFGLEYARTLLVKDIEVDYGYDLVEPLYEDIKNHGVTAAICANNVVATGIIDGLIDKGVRIPEDFSVIGFDDTRVNYHTNNIIPPITSIKQPQREMSEYAIDSIVKMIKNERMNYSRVFNCDLKIRKTTARR